MREVCRVLAETPLSPWVEQEIRRLRSVPVPSRRLTFIALQEISSKYPAYSDNNTILVDVAASMEYSYGLQGGVNCELKRYHVGDFYTLTSGERIEVNHYNFLVNCLNQILRWRNSLDALNCLATWVHGGSYHNPNIEIQFERMGLKPPWGPEHSQGGIWPIYMPPLRLMIVRMWHGYWGINFNVLAQDT